jgi:hypothetical protein
VGLLAGCWITRPNPSCASQRRSDIGRYATLANLNSARQLAIRDAPARFWVGCVRPVLRPVRFYRGLERPGPEYATMRAVWPANFGVDVWLVGQTSGAAQRAESWTPRENSQVRDSTQRRTPAGSTPRTYPRARRAHRSGASRGECRRGRAASTLRQRRRCRSATIARSAASSRASWRGRSRTKSPHNAPTAASTSGTVRTDILYFHERVVVKPSDAPFVLHALRSTNTTACCLIRRFAGRHLTRCTSVQVTAYRET